MRTLPDPATLRELVTKVAWGIAADSAGPGSLVALPHAANLRAGAAYIHWTPAIVVEPGTEVSWRFTERRVETTGTFTVWSPTDIDGVYPENAPAPVASLRGSLVRDGRAARFELASALERHVTSLLEASNRYVARELEGRLGDDPENWAPVVNHGVVDQVALDTLASELLWGADGSADSITLRMVDRAATTHINNQPLGSWFDVNLQARAEEAIRRYIGDPHIGRKIRRVAREHNPKSIEHLLEVYRRANPSESVGRERVIAALSADKTLDAVSHSLSLVSNVFGTEVLEVPHEEEATS